jgi:glutamyl-tRNA synthetase
MGYLPEALRNYLLRLGWSHGDDEVISTEQAVAWFDLDAVGKSAARFDFVKLESLNGHYLREAASERLVGEVVPRLETQLGHPLETLAKARLSQGMDGLKARAKSLVELAENAVFYVTERPLTLNDKAAKILGLEARQRLGRLHSDLSLLPEWTEAAIEAAVRAFAEAENCKLGDAAQPLRAALTGSNVSPGIFEVMVVLGREESLARIADQGSAA